MTRTERNQYPAALLKDRHSRSGLTKTEVAGHKGGDGAHNWGSLRRKGEDEAGGRLDAAADADADADGLFNLDEDLDRVGELKPNDIGNDFKHIQKDVEGTNNIATSPSESMSSLDSRVGDSPTNSRPNAGGRRLSNVSDEERERARVYREGALNKGGLDLAHIARTSYGIATSPPATSYIGATSPTKSNGGFNFRQ